MTSWRTLCEVHSLWDLQVRQLADLRTVGWPYHQRGLVATVRTETTNDIAHQRFLETGPLALLPVRDGFSNIVWSTTPSHAKELEACPPLELADRVNEVGQYPALNCYLLQMY